MISCAWSHLTRQSGSLSIAVRGNTWSEWHHRQRTQTAKLETPHWTPVAARMEWTLPSHNNHIITYYHLTHTWPGPPPSVPNRADNISNNVRYNLSDGETGHLGFPQGWMRLTWSGHYVHGSGDDPSPISQRQAQTPIYSLSFLNGAQQRSRDICLWW